ncbi:MAG TPA: glycosyltransferase family 4 protein, partial [Humisphaera sp.]|nr:glycosyltransferase family 4 protein [Humisphaera sp.]
MNIAILPSAFYPHLGGVEELVRQLSHELVRQKNQVAIHVNRWPKTLARRESFEALAVDRYCFRVPEHTAKQVAGTLLLGPRTLNDLCGSLRRQSAQVLHVQCVSSNAYYAIRAKRRLGIPLVVTLQGELTMDANRLFERSKFARGLLRSALEEADIITACSTKTREDAEAFYGRPFGARGRVIWNGASIADFQNASPFSHARPYMFALGRLVPQKGFDLMIRALAACGDASHDLLIAGDGPERTSLEHLSRELGLTARVHFTGRADRGQVASLFSGSSFFVLPSRTDEG